MQELAASTIAAPAFRSVSDSIPLGPGLALQGHRVRYRRNEEIFGEGESARHVYRVVSGAVRTIRFTSDGRRQILAFHMPGDVFGIEIGADHGCSAEAVGDSEIAAIPRALVDAAANEDVRAARALLVLIQKQLQNAQEHTLLLGRKAATERVAAFLLDLADRVASRCEINLPMSRADIADYLGLTIETVSRTFTQMERDRAIALPNARHVVVKNRSALELLEAA